MLSRVLFSIGLAFVFANCVRSGFAPTFEDDMSTVGIDGGKDSVAKIDLLKADSLLKEDSKDRDQAARDIPQKDIPDREIGTITNDIIGPIPGIFKAISVTTFIMGSPEDENCHQNFEDLHQVTLSNDFNMQSTEVTQGEFNSVMDYNPSFFTVCGNDCPVETVSWHEAAAYCNVLTARTGYRKCYNCSGSKENTICSVATAYQDQNIYSCPGYRLPTEAEWEFAFRAGSHTAFYNGNVNSCDHKDSNASKIAWYYINSFSMSNAVGQKAANQWGLYDLAGNVSEWCHDRWQDNLGTSMVIDPWGATTGDERVVRNGNWSSAPNLLRAASRGKHISTSKGYTIGFRCIRMK